MGSDDDDLDDEYCVYRRTWIGLIAVGFFLYGAWNCFYFILEMYIGMATMHQSCTGAGCDQVMSCDATREASYHFRVCTMSIGSLVFGVIGINSVYNKYSVDMFQFAVWLLVVAAVTVGVLVMDIVYQSMCDDHYSYNLVLEMVLSGFWPWGRAVKYEVRQLKIYPAEYVDSLAMHHIGRWNAAACVVKVSCLLFAAFQAFCLAQRFHYGLAGMGATYSIADWQDRLNTKYEVKDVAYNTFNMAVATGMDLGWDEDEFKLQRPLRENRVSSMYRYGNPGMMPGGMPGMPGMGMMPAQAQAYDGFRDDRRNVLL